jgi:hypothetical protein
VVTRRLVPGNSPSSPPDGGDPTPESGRIMRKVRRREAQSGLSRDGPQRDSGSGDTCQMANAAPLVKITTTPTDPLCNEAGLVEQLLRHLPGSLVPRKTSVAFTIGREIAVGRSVADVVCLIREGRARVRCVPSEPLTVIESVILATLRLHGPTRIDILEQRCGFARTFLREGALKRLAGWRLLGFENGGRVSSCGSWTGAFGIIAIEAKVTRWREALRQAVSYRRYADRSFVALPASLASTALDAAPVFADAKVGLLLVNADAVREVFPAPRVREHDWRREFVLSRLASPA